MEYTYQADTDDLYIHLTTHPVARTIELTARCLVDLDIQGHVVGIEVLNPSHGWPVQEVTQRFNLTEPLLWHLESLRPVSFVPSGQPELTLANLG